MSRDLVLGAVGDLVIDRDDPASAFAPCAPLLHAADLLFGNCEGVYTNRTERAPGASIPVLVPPHNVRGLADARFDVLSFANNHTVDGGHAGLLETLDAVEALGIATCGAGRDGAAATAPCMLEQRGRRVAFLAWSCVYPPGYEAREGVPGIAVLRYHTVYIPSDLAAFQSGSPPDSLTVADPRDLRAMRRAIVAAREQADIVVTSFHWGDGSRPSVLLDYERQIAEAAVDAGADVVLGHHHHMLRGVDVYRGKPIFYGLGHFVFDQPRFGELVPQSVLDRMREAVGEYAYAVDPEYPLLPMHPEARMTAVAVIRFRGDEIVAGLVPCLLNPQGQPVPLRLDEPDGRRVAAYLAQLNRDEELGARFRPGDLLGGFDTLTVESGA